MTRTLHYRGNWWNFRRNFRRNFQDTAGYQQVNIRDRGQLNSGISRFRNPSWKILEFSPQCTEQLYIFQTDITAQVITVLCKSVCSFVLGLFHHCFVDPVQKCMSLPLPGLGHLSRISASVSQFQKRKRIIKSLTTKNKTTITTQRITSENDNIKY